MDPAPHTLHATAPFPFHVAVASELPGRTADEPGRDRVRRASWETGQRLAAWLYVHVAADVVDQLYTALAYYREHPERAATLAPLPPPPPLT